ncbi:hypothetical protein [Prevotella aurantiaca]|uniref:Uncharacterized protein n=1 Tax=Prevotella aurantiaca TaxID=596085 RepID=A0A930MXR3_9BACT|nr:hypothetical protein [Prevotella aurantiaca]MBF1383336.1 hypothetical protein [Prevotella aurantiaca]
MNKKFYIHPDCKTYRCMKEVALLADSTDIGKGDPGHGGEDNAAKPGVWEFDSNEETN